MFITSNRLALSAMGTLLAVTLTSPAYGQSRAGNDDEIIVTGVATTEKDSLQAVDILRLEELEAKFDGSLGATLADLPGLSTTNFGPAVGRPIIRGLGGDRVRILTNGIDLIDASTVSTDHALSTEGLDVERVEVLRGAAAIPYGGNAVAGVVNVVDGSIPSKPVEDGVVDGRLYIGATSVDDGSQLAGRAKTTFGNVTLQLEGLTRQAGDVSIPGFAKSSNLRAEELADDPAGFDAGPEGVVTNTAHDFRVLGGGAAVHGDWGYVGVSARDFESHYGLPLEDEENVGIAMEQTRFDAMGEINLELGVFNKVTFSAGIVDYQHGESANGELATLFTNKGQEIRTALLNGQAGDRWNGSIGGQYVYQDFAAIGSEDFIPPAETTDFGIFGAQRYDLGGYGFEGGLRYETRKVEAVNLAALNYDTVSASGGAFLRPTDNIFTGISVSRTERAPTNAELYSNGFHPATGTVEIGNADLIKETALSLEAVLNMEGNGWKLKGSAYHTNFDDFIFLSQTGADVVIDTDTGETAPEFMYVQNDGTFKGFEVFGEADVASFGFADLTADVTAEYVRGETDTLGNAPYIPPFSIILGASLEAEHWQLRADIETVSAANNQANFELPTDGYTLIGVQAQIKPFERDDLNLIVALENLTNEEARLNTSQLKDIVPLPGRNLRVSLSLDF